MHKQITGLQPSPVAAVMVTTMKPMVIIIWYFWTMTHLSTHLRGNPSSQDKVHIYMYTVEITTSFHITLFVYRGVACKTKLIEKEI